MAWRVSTCKHWLGVVPVMPLVVTVVVVDVVDGCKWAHVTMWSAQQSANRIQLLSQKQSRRMESFFFVVCLSHGMPCSVNVGLHPKHSKSTPSQHGSQYGSRSEQSDSPIPLESPSMVKSPPTLHPRWLLSRYKINFKRWLEFIVSPIAFWFALVTVDPGNKALQTWTGKLRKLFTLWWWTWERLFTTTVTIVTPLTSDKYSIWGSVL